MQNVRLPIHFQSVDAFNRPRDTNERDTALRSESNKREEICKTVKPRNTRAILSHLRLGSGEAYRLSNLTSQEVSPAESAQLCVGIQQTGDSLRLSDQSQTPPEPRHINQERQTHTKIGVGGGRCNGNFVRIVTAGQLDWET